MGSRGKDKGHLVLALRLHLPFKAFQVRAILLPLVLQRDPTTGAEEVPIQQMGVPKMLLVR